MYDFRTLLIVNSGNQVNAGQKSRQQAGIAGKTRNMSGNRTCPISGQKLFQTLYFLMES